jgi:hypothetical protein
MRRPFWGGVDVRPVEVLGEGLSELSLVRYRASLSSFFGWYVCERIIRANPVTADRTRTRCPSHLQ